MDKEQEQSKNQDTSKNLEDDNVDENQNEIETASNEKEEVIKTWKKNISDLSECPNVQIKLGGLGMPITGHDWHQREIPVGSDELANQMKFYLDFCIEKFGTDRGMFESNFPVDKVSFSYDVLYNAFKKYSKEYSKSERSALFHDNAISFYKVEEL